jgi:hypothetical protein
MTALRTTKHAKLLPIRDFSRSVLWCLVAFGLYGCGTATPPETETSALNSTPAIVGANDPSWLTSREKLPAPDTDRIEYDREKRMLFLYDLPGRDNWMIQLPDDKIARLVGPLYRIPEGVDTSRTLVYYSRAGMKTSAPVTVAQIEAGRLGHTSLAIGH